MVHGVNNPLHTKNGKRGKKKKKEKENERRKGKIKKLTL